MVREKLKEFFKKMGLRPKTRGHAVWHLLALPFQTRGPEAACTSRRAAPLPALRLRDPGSSL